MSNIDWLIMAPAIPAVPIFIFHYVVASVGELDTVGEVAQSRPWTFRPVSFFRSLPF
jgi:hypothetical protein